MTPHRSLRRAGIFEIAFAATLLSACAVHADPGTTDPFKCPDTGGTPGPVPGKPGETGTLVATEKDDAGNLIELWCLEKNDQHNGPDFGLRFKTANNGPDVWIAACVFPQGRNQFAKRF